MPRFELTNFRESSEINNNNNNKYNNKKISQDSYAYTVNRRAARPVNRGTTRKLDRIPWMLMDPKWWLFSTELCSNARAVTQLPVRTKFGARCKLDLAPTAEG